MQGLRGGFSFYAPRDCVLPLGPSTPILNGANSNCLPTCLPGQVEEVMTLAWLGMFCGPTVGTGTPRAACWGGAGPRTSPGTSSGARAAPDPSRHVLRPPPLRSAHTYESSNNNPTGQDLVLPLVQVHSSRPDTPGTAPCLRAPDAGDPEQGELALRETPSQATQR